MTGREGELALNNMVSDIAKFRGDAARLEVELLNAQKLGEFAQALRSIGEPIHGKPAQEVSMGRVLLQLMDYTRTFGMHLRPELVLLQKTMVQVEGVARAAEPGGPGSAGSRVCLHAQAVHGK